VSRDAALIVTYHAIEEGSSPLCIEPSLFRLHLDWLAELGATTVTVAELAAAIQAGKLPPLAVAITFDDGCASAVRVAAPLLAERGQKATFFCVAGHVGGVNDWPTRTTGIPRLELAAADELAELAALGFEIGAHGMDHTPLRGLSDADLDRQIREPRAKLEDAISTEVRCLAYPYGAMPDAAAAQLVAEVYVAACTTTLERVTASSDPLALPRIDAHYLRRRSVFRRVAAGGLDSYVRVRRFGRLVGRWS
jgi:peptidoglycan/xylan/chitin deacetylase (PgdA/CDA1 family)